MTNAIPEHASIGFVANKGPYGSTLPGQLASLLADVHDRFGARDMSWTVVGIDIGPAEPHIRFHQPGKFIWIRLGANARTDGAAAYYQLAHEAVHLISPTGKASANVLEEGIAETYAREEAKKVGFQPAGYPSYDRAVALFGELQTLEPRCVQMLRAKEQSSVKSRET